MPVAGVEGDTDVLKHRRCVVTCRPAAEREGNVGKTYGLVQGSVATPASDVSIAGSTMLGLYDPMRQSVGQY